MATGKRRHSSSTARFPRGHVAFITSAAQSLMKCVLMVLELKKTREKGSNVDGIPVLMRFLMVFLAGRILQRSPTGRQLKTALDHVASIRRLTCPSQWNFISHTSSTQSCAPCLTVASSAVHVVRLFESSPPKSRAFDTRMLHLIWSFLNQQSFAASVAESCEPIAAAVTSWSKTRSRIE